MSQSDSAQSTYISYLSNENGSIPLKKKQISKKNGNFISKKEYFNLNLMKKINSTTIPEEIFVKKVKSNNQSFKGDDSSNNFFNRSQVFNLNSSPKKDESNTMKLDISKVSKLSEQEFLLSRQVSRTNKSRSKINLNKNGEDFLSQLKKSKKNNAEATPKSLLSSSCLKNPNTVSLDLNLSAFSSKFNKSSVDKNFKVTSPTFDKNTIKQMVINCTKDKQNSSTATGLKKI